MCGRLTQKMTWRELHGLYGLLDDAPPGNMRPRFNGAPTQDFAVCRAEPPQGADTGEARTLSRLRWGLIPSWAKDARIGSRLINARAETVDAKPAFRAAFKARRCLIPADGWFEWVHLPAQRGRQDGGKSPRFLSMADGSIASFAALWERWDGQASLPRDGLNQAGLGIVESFTIITTGASPELAAVHARQPAIVDPRHFSDWLAPDTPKDVLLDIARRPHPGPYRIKPVSNRVNNVRNDGPEVLRRH